MGQPAEHVSESLGKGNRGLVVAELSTESWTEKNGGEKRTADKVNVTAIGPSRRDAIAKVVKVRRSTTPDYDQVDQQS